MGSFGCVTLLALVPAAVLAAAGGVGPPPLAMPQKTVTGCLGGQGFLRARIRGALARDIDWSARLTCAGEARPDGSGVRVSFVAPPGPGPRLRVVFGVQGVREGVAGRELPTNLTVMEEGGRIFATRGDDRCTTDQLSQRPMAPPAARTHVWRITARGFCTGPANALAGRGRIVVSRFDFAGVVAFGGAAQ